MSTKNIALTRALALLNASGFPYVVLDDQVIHQSPGLQFAIRMPDNQVHGNLTLEQTKKRKQSGLPRQSWTHTGYVAAVQGLNVSDAWKYICANQHDAIMLQKVVSACACKAFGSDNYITSVGKDNGVEVLRVL